MIFFLEIEINNGLLATLSNTFYQQHNYANLNLDDELSILLAV